MAGFAAPWRDKFLQDVSKLPIPAFVLATLRSPDSQPHVLPRAQTPRARTVVFRGMWASLPMNDRNPAPQNGSVYESDLPAITTDVRMEKVAELMYPEHGGADGQESGGGGPVEAVFWVPDSMTQWRLRGVAYVVGPDIERDKAAAVRSLIRERMRITGNSSAAPDSWGWAREVTAHFGNLSPKMRGSFRSPPPGFPRSSAPQDSSLRLGQEVTDLHDPVARRNFRIIVIIPEEVDQVDLGDQKRWKYQYSKEKGWEVCEIWP